MRDFLSLHVINPLKTLVFSEGERCILCERDLPVFVSIPLCLPCFKRLPLVGPAICTVCGRPVRNDGLCWQCRKGMNSYISAVRALFIYDGVIRELLQGLKYRGRTEYARLLGKLMALRLPEFSELQYDVLVPVPLHRNRFELRGYNQAFLLAQEIAAAAKAPILVDAVIRSHETRAQSGVGGSGRYQNLRGAFHVANPGMLRNRTVLLVDDIYTTGATMNELARVLLRSGAAAVKGYSCAISVNDVDFVSAPNL